jgi:hypothetical protein
MILGDDDGGCDTGAYVVAGHEAEVTAVIQVAT